MYTVSAALRSTQGKDGAIVLDVQRGRIFRLNPTAHLILTQLEQGHCEAQIVSELSGQFHIPPGVARRDMCDLLQALEQYGLIHTTSDASPEAGQGAMLP